MAKEARGSGERAAVSPVQAQGGEDRPVEGITERTSPRSVRAVALPKPTERERTQWYFQQLIQPLERRVGDGLLHA